MRDATIFADKDVVVMLLQSVTALLRVPARSNANTVSVALGDEENIASLHLHNGSGFAVFASAIDSPAATITHRENTVVVNFAERIEIVSHGKSKLFEFALFLNPGRLTSSPPHLWGKWGRVC